PEELRRTALRPLFTILAQDFLGQAARPDQVCGIDGPHRTWPGTRRTAAAHVRGLRAFSGSTSRSSGAGMGAASSARTVASESTKLRLSLYWTTPRCGCSVVNG